MVFQRLRGIAAGLLASTLAAGTLVAQTKPLQQPPTSSPLAPPSGVIVQPMPPSVIPPQYHNAKVIDIGYTTKACVAKTEHSLTARWVHSIIFNRSPSAQDRKKVEAASSALEKDVQKELTALASGISPYSQQDMNGVISQIRRKGPGLAIKFEEAMRGMNFGAPDILTTPPGTHPDAPVQYGGSYVTVSNSIDITIEDKAFCRPKGNSVIAADAALLNE
jgi:hypothetical protein